MKNIICFFFALNVTLVLGQITGTIEYKLVIGLDEFKMKHIANILERASIGAAKTNFILELEQHESYFYLQDNIFNTERDVLIAIAMAEYENLIYSNSNNKINLFNNSINYGFKKNEFLVKDTIIDSWTLTNETKMIHGLNCIKATTLRTIIEPNRKLTKNIIAWFCPTVPVQLGPMGFGGLPGLILELNIDNILFGAKIINFNSLKKEITKPSIGKIVYSKEYDGIKLLRNIENMKLLEGNR